MKTLTDRKVPPQYHSKISLTLSLHSTNHILGSCEGHIESNQNREARDTSHQVHSDIVLWDHYKDGRPSGGDSWEEHSVGWYLWQKGRNRESQELELEEEKCSRVEGDYSSPYPPPPLPKTLQYKPPVPLYKGLHWSQDWNSLE